MFWIFKRFKDLWSIFNSRDSARQMGWALALGMLAGVVPKGNLTSIILITIAFSCRINVAIGVLSMFAFSWIGQMMFDPLGAPVGEFILTLGFLQGFWHWFFNLPIIPWTSLNDTLVMGNLVLGLAALYPLARAAIPMWQRFLDRKVRPAETTEDEPGEDLALTGPASPAS